MFNNKRIWSLIAVIGIIISLTACGFRPLYTSTGVNGEDKYIQDELSQIFIDEIEGFHGQKMRRQLLSLISPEHEVERGKYRLYVNIGTPIKSELGVKRNNQATRFRLSYNVKYTLYSFPEMSKLKVGSVSKFSSYDVNNSPRSSDVARDVMEDRLLKDIAYDIAIQLSSYFKKEVISEQE